MTPENLADILRTAAIPCAAITAAISLRVVVDHRYRSVAQLCRFLGLALLCIGLAFGEYHSLGRTPFWPVLILLWAGLAFSLAGTVPMVFSHDRSEEHHA